MRYTFKHPTSKFPSALTLLSARNFILQSLRLTARLYSCWTLRSLRMSSARSCLRIQISISNGMRIRMHNTAALRRRAGSISTRDWRGLTSEDRVCKKRFGGCTRSRGLFYMCGAFDTSAKIIASFAMHSSRDLNP
jgi:hypothetical protein